MAVAQVYQLKVTLRHIKPPMWRRILVPGSITLEGLHHVLQVAMGWAGGHLHEWEVGGVRYGEPDPEWGEDVRSEHSARLSRVAAEGDRLRYTYDFGDFWEHLVLVEKVRPRVKEEALPACIAGRRGCPPEDVGGPGGYEDFLEAYADPEHPEHESWREWAGPYFSPEEFDAAQVTAQLQG